MTYSLFLFFLKYFFYYKFFLICFLQFFFLNCSNNIFTIKINNNICPWNWIFNFANYKNLFRPIRSISFSKNVFVFYIFTWSLVLNLGSLALLFFPKSIYIIFNINRVHFNCSVICVLLYLSTISSSSSNTHFLILKSCICKLYSLKF